jgi:hypothetical protein
MYSDEVSKFETLDACLNEEQVLMASLDEVQSRLDVVKYELPKEVTFENVTYSKTQVGAMIAKFLNKLEVKWEQTLGLHQLVQLWNSDAADVAYRVYDSTLRCLNQVTFKGDEEWTQILIVNAYLSLTHNEYSLDTGMVVYLSEMHNLVMDRMKELGGDVPEQMN